MKANEYEELRKRINENQYDLMGIDQNVLAYNLGYETLDQYYEDLKCIKKMHKITTPTFFFSCLNDPCVHRDMYPFKEI